MVGASTEAVAVTTGAETFWFAFADTDGASTEAVAVTTVAVTDTPVETVGAGTLAVAVTTLGVAVALAAAAATARNRRRRRAFSRLSGTLVRNRSGYRMTAQGISRTYSVPVIVTSSVTAAIWRTTIVVFACDAAGPQPSGHQICSPARTWNAPA
jgi:hypothetical protein